MSKIMFLPQDYQSPKAAGAYMKLQEGENRFRILTAPLLGWEDWLDKKPVRFRFEAKPVRSIDPNKPIKHFWAFVVWNYMEERIQVLQITQATIRNTLEALAKDKDWGHPVYYDIKIIKSGAGKDTEYAVTAIPHKALDARIKEAFLQTPCNLDALYSGDDPFSPGQSHYTPGAFDVDEELEMPAKSVRGVELFEMMKQCSPAFQEHIKLFCIKNSIAVDFSNLPEHLCDRIEKGIMKDLNSSLAMEA